MTHPELPSLGSGEPGVLAVCFETPADPGAVRDVLRGLGLERGLDGSCRWFEPGMLLVRLGDRLDAVSAARAGRAPGVRHAALIGREGLAARPPGGATTQVPLGPNAAVGGPAPVVIAGPCSVESAEQACAIAECVRAAGAHALRGGAFKPRTSPYAFGGLGEEALEHLVRARQRTGLPIVTEALDPGHLDRVAEQADVIQIGSRNMHNQAILFAAGGHPSGKPVLLKRGFAATLEEFLQAAETVLLGRVFRARAPEGVILCVRGIRTFEDAPRFTMDVGAIPVLQERTHLPVIADPSHPAGARRFVRPLARAALAAGAAGLLVEVHDRPEEAWCDGAQSLAPEEFRALMDDVRATAGGSGG